MLDKLQNIMGNLQDAQQKAEEAKKRLDNVSLTEEGANGKIKIRITGNREIKDIEIDESLMQDSEELADHLVITLNKAIQKATEMNERELQQAAAGAMDLGELGKMFGG